MKMSTIQFNIQLDDNNIPEKIEWEATDKPEPGRSETKSISISLWDQHQQNTMRIDLWAKDMPVNEMKKFYVDCIGGLGQSVLSSTQDEFMAQEINALCDRLGKYVQGSTSS